MRGAGKADAVCRCHCVRVRVVDGRGLKLMLACYVTDWQVPFCSQQPFCVAMGATTQLR